MRYAGLRNPRAETNPLRSIPLFRDARQILRQYTPRERVEWALAIARRDLPRMEEFFARSCTTLGRANSAPAALRRGRQAKAMKQLNGARADLRRARADLAKAEAALFELDANPSLPGFENGGCPVPQRRPGGPAWDAPTHRPSAPVQPAA